MKKSIVSGIISGMLLLMGAGIASADSTCSPWLDQQQWNQEQRIRAGIDSGNLTPWETRALDREQARIRWMEANMKADGYLSGRERLILLQEQNRAGLNIWRMKHNGYRY